MRGRVVVGRGLRHRLRRGVEWVGEVRRVGQGALPLGPPPVGHEPAGYGHRYRHEREERCDDHREY